MNKQPVKTWNFKIQYDPNEELSWQLYEGGSTNYMSFSDVASLQSHIASVVVEKRQEALKFGILKAGDQESLK